MSNLNYASTTRAEEKINLKVRERKRLNITELRVTLWSWLAGSKSAV
jgi:hypothetical protein